MLITILVADTFSLSNYYREDSNYASDLEIGTVSTRKGLATETFHFSINKATLDYLGQSFMYLTYKTPIKVFLSEQLYFSGTIEKIDIDEKEKVTLDASSLISYVQDLPASPYIAPTCQNQVYSKNCGILAKHFAYHFEQVTIDGLSGYATIDIDAANDSISLGGSAAVVSQGPFDGNLDLLDGNNVLFEPVVEINDKVFLNLEYWWDAYVIINGLYKAQVVNVTEDRIYFSINYTNEVYVTDKLDIYLKCDKTYGQCFLRFNNTQHFYGFANNYPRLSNYDIFSAKQLHYCGEELADEPTDPCPTDNSIYGVKLDG